MKTNTSNTTSDKRRKFNPADPVTGAENEEMVNLKVLIEKIEKSGNNAPKDIEPDLVTVNSLVEILDLDSDKTMTVTIVNPPDVDVRMGRISLLSPLGSALMGHEVRSIVKFKAPMGEKKVMIKNIIQQPVAHGVLAD